MTMKGGIHLKGILINCIFIIIPRILLQMNSFEEFYDFIELLIA